MEQKIIELEDRIIQKIDETIENKIGNDFKDQFGLLIDLLKVSIIKEIKLSEENILKSVNDKMNKHLRRGGKKTKKRK